MNRSSTDFELAASATTFWITNKGGFGIVKVLQQRIMGDVA